MSIDRHPMEQLSDMKYDYLSNPDTPHTIESIVDYGRDWCGLDCWSWEDVCYYIDEYYGYNDE